MWRATNSPATVVSLFVLTSYVVVGLLEGTEAPGNRGAKASIRALESSIPAFRSMILTLELTFPAVELAIGSFASTVLTFEFVVRGFRSRVLSLASTILGFESTIPGLESTMPGFKPLPFWQGLSAFRRHPAEPHAAHPQCPRKTLA